MEFGTTIRKTIVVDGFVASDQGTRAYQQDAARVQTRGSFAAAVLCDGMGGLNGGEKASELGVNLFLRDLQKQWPVADLPEFLRMEACRLDRAVMSLENDEGQPLQAGSTVIAVVVSNGKAYWVSVGDSRIYLFRNGEMCCLTKAHNYKTMLKEQLETGEIGMETYTREIAQGEALTSYLGIGDLSLIDQNEKPLELWEEDILLLCSDGLYKTLTEEQIRALVNESGSHLGLAGNRLLETAHRRGAGGQDNTTVALLKLIGVDADKGGVNFA